MGYMKKYDCESLIQAAHKLRDTAMRIADFTTVIDLQPELTPGEVRTTISTKGSLLRDLRGYTAEVDRQIYIKCGIDPD